MIKRFAILEFKNFMRSKSFAANAAMKILQGFLIVYFLVAFVSGSVLAFYYPHDKLHIDPLPFVSRFLIYALLGDLFLRYFMQQMPTQNIKAFLTMNIKKDTLVKYLISKTFLSFFTWGNAFLYMPFVILYLANGYSVVGTLGWIIAIVFCYFINNLLNILMNGKDSVAYVIGGLLLGLIALNYYNIIAIGDFSALIFTSFFNHPWLCIVPILIFVPILYFVFRQIKSMFYLDKVLELKQVEGKTENIQFLNKFGVLGTFLNNDIRMLKRSKAARSVALGGFLFLFYGLLIFSTPSYKTPTMLMFLGIFVTGGFQMLFGQKVPSFDSSYYPLMMTLNVPYKDYLKAKWWLMTIATFASMVLAIFYFYFGWKVYVTFFAAGLYNIGVNSQVTLLSGAFNKNPIDLNTVKKSFGQQNNLSFKNFLLIIPKMLLPMLIYGVVNKFAGTVAAVAAIAILGAIGFLLREKIFDYIVRLYKKEKYDTLIAFKKTT
ncbi:DUF5687 family protein [Soonwooa sp.]|uniref:DUF5687 family protein n=1 Tax=Soonwooa sp. TaxID=1938592 RepID=UPI00260A4A7E|nr:DUF5687 family protein [Soonwooa sp.]